MIVIKIVIIAIEGYNRRRLADCITRLGWEAIPVHPDSLLENTFSLFTGAEKPQGIIHIMSTDFPFGLEFLKNNSSEIPYLNPVDAVLASADKYITANLIFKRGVPIPLTYKAKGDKDLKKYANKIGYPVVLKQPDGAEGEYVALAKEPQTLIKVADSIRARGQTLIVQEYIEESGGRDLRVIVVGSKVVAAMERIATKPGEFRANIHLGAVGRPVELTEEEVRVAIAATQAVGLDLAGVDILRSKRGPQVIEINSFPGLEGIEKYTSIDVADSIVSLLADRIGSATAR